MPELPDVEIFRRLLARTSLHREIERVRVLDPTMLHGVSQRRLAATLRGRRFEATHRHGKHLLVDLTDDGVLALHFGMTGHLATDRDDPPAEQHVRLVVSFLDGHQLAMVDQRRLGHVALARSIADYVDSEGLGPDVLTLSGAELRDTVRSSRGTLKSALMDQGRLAGMGNIYSDEVLFQAHLDPRSPAARLDDAASRRLHRQLHRVSDLAVARGADPERLPRTWLLPSREDGAPCPRGNGTVRKYRAVGRSGYWCPTCQGG